MIEQTPDAPQDKSRILYDALSKNPTIKNLPDYEKFSATMLDSTKRRVLYDALSRNPTIKNIPDFNGFSNIFVPDKPVEPQRKVEPNEYKVGQIVSDDIMKDLQETTKTAVSMVDTNVNNVSDVQEQDQQADIIQEAPEPNQDIPKWKQEYMDRFGTDPDEDGMTKSQYENTSDFSDMLNIQKQLADIDKQIGEFGLETMRRDRIPIEQKRDSLKKSMADINERLNTRAEANFRRQIMGLTDEDPDPLDTLNDLKKRRTELALELRDSSRNDRFNTDNISRLRQEVIDATDQVNELDKALNGTAGEKIVHVATMLARGTTELPAGFFGGVATLAKTIDDLFTDGKPKDEYATARYAQAIRDFAEETFQGDERMMGKFWSDVAAGAGTMFGYMLLGMLTGGAGAGLARVGGATGATARTAGVRAGQRAAGVSAGSSGMDRMYDEVLAATGDEEKAKIAGALGIGPGVLQVANVSRLLGKWDQALGGKIRMTTLNHLKEAGVSGLNEAIVETLGEAGFQLIASIMTDEDIKMFDEWQRTSSVAGTAGALTGFMNSLAMALMTRGKGGMMGRSAFRPETPEPKTIDNQTELTQEETNGSSEDIITEPERTKTDEKTDEVIPKETIIPETAEDTATPKETDADATKTEGTSPEPSGEGTPGESAVEEVTPTVEAVEETKPVKEEPKPKKPVKEKPKTVKETKEEVKPAPEIVAPTDEGEAAPTFRKQKIKSIATDVDRFQNRDTEYSEETVTNIVEDYKAGRLELDNIPPILVWKDPADSKTYVVGGHSRLEAFKRLGVTDIQTQELVGLTEEQAKLRGREDNALGTSESVIEQSKLVREWRDSGMSKAELERKGKQLFKNNARLVTALSALNPNGKALGGLRALEKNESDDRTKAQNFAKYIGEVRLRNPQITDSHETELYNYLLENDNTNTKSQRDFIGFVDRIVERNTTFGEFDSTKPLNIKGVKPLTTIETEYAQRIKEARSVLDKAQKTFNDKVAEIERRRSVGENLNEIAVESSLKKLRDEISSAQREVIKLETESGKVKQGAQSQGGLFGQETAPVQETKTTKDELVDDIKDFADEFGDKPNVAVEVSKQDDISVQVEKDKPKTERLNKKPRAVIQLAEDQPLLFANAVASIKGLPLFDKASFPKASNVSESFYIEADRNGEVYEIRVSAHDDKHSGTNSQRIQVRIQELENKGIISEHDSFESTFEQDSDYSEWLSNREYRDDAFVFNPQNAIKEAISKPKKPKSETKPSKPTKPKSEVASTKADKAKGELKDMLSDFAKEFGNDLNAGLNPKAIEASAKIIAKGTELGFRRFQQFGYFIIENLGKDTWKNIFKPFKASYMANIGVDNTFGEDLNVISKLTAEDVINEFDNRENVVDLDADEVVVDNQSDPTNPQEIIEVADETQNQDEQIASEEGVSEGPVFTEYGKDIAYKYPDATPDGVKGKLRPHQQKAVNAIVGSFNRGKKAFLLADGAGAGKTRPLIVAANVIKDSGKRVLMVTQNQEIINDSFKSDAKELGYKFTQDNDGDSINGIPITTITKLAKQNLSNYDVIILDESQKASGLDSKAGLSIREFPGYIAYASATPFDNTNKIAYILPRMLGITEDQFLQQINARIDTRYNRGLELVFNKGNMAPFAQFMNTLHTKFISDGTMLHRRYEFFGEEGTFMSDGQNYVNDGTGIESLADAESMLDDYYDYKARNAVLTNYEESQGETLDGKKRKIREAGAIERNTLVETYKATPELVTQIKDKIKQGNQVVVYGTKVSDNLKFNYLDGDPDDGSASGLTYTRPSFMSQMQALLNKEGIAYESVTGDNKSKSVSVENFQTGKTKVLLVNQSGTTGINLNDTAGNAPRTLYIAGSLPSAIELEQLKGRVSRLNNASKAEAIYVNAPTSGDAKITTRTNNKMAILNSILLGEQMEVVGDVDIVNTRPIKTDNEAGTNLDSAPDGYIFKTISPKAFVVLSDTLDTRDIKDLLKSIGGKWNRSHTGWMFPISKADEVAQAIEEGDIGDRIHHGSMGKESMSAMEPLSDKYKDVMVRKQGDHVVAISNNVDHVAILSSLDAKYNPDTNEFVISDMSKKDLLEIIDTYGQMKADNFKSALFEIDSTQTPKTVPNWVKEKGESTRGRNFISRIRKDTKGASIGLRSIVDYLNEIADTEMRAGKSQTTKRHPAHYNPLGHLIRSRVLQSVINFHEAGHAISALIRNENKKWWDQNLKSELKSLTKQAGGKGVYASAKSAEEGFAEFIRMYVMDQSELDPELVSKIETYLSQNHPKIYRGLRDTARMYYEHSQRDFAARANSRKHDKGIIKPKKESRREAREKFLYRYFSVEQANDALMDKIFRTMAEVDINVAREWRKGIKGTKSDILSSWQTIYSIKTEVARALQGDKNDGGVRIFATAADSDGTMTPSNVISDIHDAAAYSPKQTKILEAIYESLHTDNIVDAMRKVGFNISSDATRHGEYLNLSNVSIDKIRRDAGWNKWDDFKTYGQYKTALYRLARFGRNYPGVRDTEAPAEAQKFVTQMEKENPGWKEQYEKVNNYMRQLLLIQAISGEKSPGEVLIMSYSHEYYWPLNKISETKDGIASTPKSKGKPGSGVKADTGSELAFADFDDVVRMRTSNALEAYYMNRYMMSIRSMISDIKKNPKYNKKAKYIAQRMMMPLNLDTKMVANLSKSEAQKAIADYLNQELERVVDQSTDELAVQDAQDMLDAGGWKAEDIDLVWGGMPIYRSTDPNLIQVIAPFENGQRKFYQIGDPLLFDLMTRDKNPRESIKQVSEVLYPVVEAFKRPISHNILFSLRQLFGRNIPQQVIFAEHKRQLIPAWNTGIGIMNRITGNQVSVSDQSFLLALAFNRTTKKEHATMVENFKAIVNEGIYDEYIQKQHEQGNYIKPILGQVANLAVKQIDIIHHVTGQRALSVVLESIAREGAMKTELDLGFPTETAVRGYQRETGNFASYPGSATAHAMYKIAGYMNPAIQTYYQEFRKLFFDPDPKVITEAWVAKIPIIMLYSAAGAALNILLTLAGSKDEEEEERRVQNLKERPWNDRVIFKPVGTLFKLPFGYGIGGAAESYAWNMAESYIIGNEMGSKEAAKILLSRMKDYPGNPIDMLNPYIKTALELGVNHNFFYGQKIVPAWLESMYPYNPELQYYASTPMIYRNIGELISASPLKVQYAIRSYMSRSTDQILTVLDKIEKGEKVEPSDYPFIGGAFQREFTGSYTLSVQKLTDLNAEFERIDARIKHLMQSGKLTDEEFNRLMESRDKYIDANASYKDVSQIRSNIRKLQNEIDYERNTKAPGYEQRIKEIQEMINGDERYMNQVAREYFQFMKPNAN